MGKTAEFECNSLIDNNLSIQVAPTFYDTAYIQMGVRSNGLRFDALVGLIFV